MKSITGVLSAVKTVGRYAGMGLSVILYGIHIGFSVVSAVVLKAHKAVEGTIKPAAPKAPEPPIEASPPIKVKVKSPPPTTN